MEYLEQVVSNFDEQFTKSNFIFLHEPEWVAIRAKLVEGPKTPTNSAMDAIQALRELEQAVNKLNLKYTGSYENEVLRCVSRARTVLELHQ